MRRQDWILTLCIWILLVVISSYIIQSNWDTQMTKFEQEQSIKINRIDSILVKYTK